MKVAIKITNERLKLALEAANGRASRHTASLSDVIHAAANAESSLESLGLPKSVRCGAEVTFMSGSNVANAYKYARKVTMATMVRGASGWFVTQLFASKAWPSDNAGNRHPRITSEQDEYLVAALRRRYSVKYPVVISTNPVAA